MSKFPRRKLVTLEGDETYQQLVEMAKSTKVLNKPPTALKPGDIHVALDVFQWRLPRRNIEPSDMHTLELVRVIQDGEHPLPPLLVYLIGERFYVLDGHHRLRAYRSVGWTKDIPVEVFTGTLERARAVALQCNSRNKLPMTREDKSEAAWKLTKNMPHLPKAQVHALSTVSPRTIGSMRAKWRQLCELAGTEEGREQLAPFETVEDMREKLTWARARMTTKGLQVPNSDDWREAEAEKMTQLLVDHVGHKLMRNPDVTAEALRRLDPELPRALIYEWARHEWETIKELADAQGEEIEF